MKAYAWRTGRIDFGRAVPDGALEIVDLPAKECRRLIKGTARIAYDNKTLLVPGVPEADEDDKALDALIRYRNWINKRPKGGRHEHSTASPR